jgi:hypothetical protein
MVGDVIFAPRQNVILNLSKGLRGGGARDKSEHILCFI